MRTTVRVLLTVILLVVAGFLGYDVANYYLYSPWTRDARVRANVVAVAPDVSGYIDDIRVKNDQFVHKGDILFTIDQDRYKLALADAEAKLAAQDAQRQMLLEQYERRAKLTPGYSITAENLDNARQLSETAVALFRELTAARDTAALNLRRTEVRAQVNGFVTNLTLAKGTFAAEGKPVMAVIDSDSYRVEAYFEETKIRHVKPGAIAEIRLMDGSPAMQGTVSSIARGITDQDNKDGPQLLSSVNPTFTWVRLAQRIPVTIRLPALPADELISAGMTCTIVMKDAGGTGSGIDIRKMVSGIFGKQSKG